MSHLFGALQRVVPQHGLSRFIGRVAASEQPWIKNLFIRQFARVYGVNLAEAEEDNFDDYRSFNDFFTRALKADARPIADGIVCPADGSVSQLGIILEELKSDLMPINPTIMRVMRVLRIARGKND